MTDATDPLLRDPLVQYLGILRAQHADYHPLSDPDLAALVEPYLAASSAMADLVVAAVDSLGERGLEEAVGLLRAMILPVVTAGTPETAIGEAVAYVEARMREQHPAADDGATGVAPFLAAAHRERARHSDLGYGVAHDQRHGEAHLLQQAARLHAEERPVAAYSMILAAVDAYSAAQDVEWKSL